MTFSPPERERLARLADVLIPAVDQYASASQADVGGRGLDLVLAARPDMAAALASVLQLAQDDAADDAVARLRLNDSASFGVLAEFAAAAYFLNPDVLRAIGYGGQNAHPIDPHPDYLDEGLLESVIQRGPIYRPTPQTAS
jgi:hypothetical protein